MVATERTIDYYPGTVVTGAIEDLVCQTRISLHFSRRTSHPYIRKLSFDKTKGAECVLHKKEEGFWPWGKTRKNFVTNIRVMAAGAIALRQTSCTADSKTDGATFKKEYIPAVPKVHVDDDADSGEVIVAENNLAKKVPEPTGTITPVPIVIASAIVTPFDASLPEETLMETPEASDEMDEAEASAHPIPSALVTPDHDVLINLNTVARGKVSGMYDNQGDMETKKYVDNIPKTAAEEKKIFKDDGVIDDQFRRKELIKEAPAETYAPECQLNFNSINHIIAKLSFAARHMHI